MKVREAIYVDVAAYSDTICHVRSSALPEGPSRAGGPWGYLRAPLDYLEACRARYGDAFTLRIPYEPPWVVLSDPADVNAVFRGDPAVLHAGASNEILVPLLGSTSVLVLDGPPHLAARRTLLPPFHGDALRGYADMIRDVAEREVATWPRGGEVRTLESMQRITMTVILRTALGPDADVEPLRERISALLGWSVKPQRLLALALLPGRSGRVPGLRRALAAVDELLYAEIARRREAAGGTDILDLLLATSESDAEVRDQLITVLLAGHDTTASSLGWALDRLSREPEVYAELAERADDDAHVGCVVKETLRLRPVLPLVVRKLMAPFIAAGRELPAGAAVAPCIHLVHRREDLYPDPAAFRPERFADGDPPGSAYLPFGGGMRRCVGAAFASLEMREVLKVVAREVRFAPADGPGERVARRGITLAPARGATVTLA